jgi:hypothetical protein
MLLKTTNQYQNIEMQLLIRVLMAFYKIDQPLHRQIYQNLFHQNLDIKKNFNNLTKKNEYKDQPSLSTEFMTALSSFLVARMSNASKTFLIRFFLIEIAPELSIFIKN